MISRTRFLPPLLATLGLAGAASVIAACGGVVSLGNTGDSADKLSSVPPSTVAVSTSTTPIGACPAGYAHPNICCDAAQGQTPTCGAWSVDPFRACNSGWTTYPNALSCCPLGSADPNPLDCIDTPDDAGVNVPPPPLPIGCGFICPPGWWPEPNAPVPVTSGSGSAGGGSTVSSGNSGTSGNSAGAGGSSSGGTINPGGPNIPVGGGCCTTLSDGTTECDGFGYAEPVDTGCAVAGSGSSSSGGPPTSCVCNCPANDPNCACDCDAGPAPNEPVGCGCSCPSNDPNCVCDCEDAGTTSVPPPETCDAGSPYPPGFDGGPVSLCAPCPPGWQVGANDPLLCCTTGPDGAGECFSQATGSATGFSGSGGSSTVSVPPSSGGSNASGSSAGSSSSSSSGG